MYSFYNNQFMKETVVICPGEYCVTADDVILQTVLGSCIAVCLYTDGGGVCGMNHFLLPSTKHLDRDILQSDAGRYGINAMELLINSMMKRGVCRQTMRAKVFGGGSMFSGAHVGVDIARDNIAFIREFLSVERIPVTGSNLGGTRTRKVMFFTSTREVLLASIDRKEAQRDLAAEDIYRHRVSAVAPGEDITFFDD